ncbi:protein NEOXANTHIN-DEFICIENT 1 isoform X1 [Punica granatum]|uniref:Protein NEOXANTHIN-DEFICIENT 1 isoform X1 n=2 Tax=Punica granatum TaxID=22663 RepID=A0A6P8CUL9_PUNGR|nr:protein NEOXANTHIN-DEFICIENT 1 isoform X1 [Punica granatum]XP_031387577.1 protein NEOXANTHIN-DEFICIENT 1 isoform X1 [Punica granatum]XP_031387579.1 protein NEOXANTHIN-DEFICIENT 1 isoform X1 [Punica granatum]XP_031387580.1 protein NEOXANTHIN-DEFICIENT 1 isoform X1 [Punica granatum]PKI57860.1 hypothetical protein CRG98_021763 [Punica granatum]
MDSGETKRVRGYGKPPWIFRGRALYQLHLVKAETARALIPKEFRLVEAFGYTLGGFFLASYEDSPAGVFDELVVIAGTVWNPPTSCAWAAKVLVNSDEACEHGRKDVGLPSQVATFSKRLTPAPQQPPKRKNRFLSILGFGGASATNQMEVSVSEMNSPASADPCHINLTTFVPAERVNKWRGPAVKLWLPSFSGRTNYNLNLLKYNCQIDCRVRAVSPLKVTKLSSHMGDITREQEDHECRSSGVAESGRLDSMENEQNLSLSVMLSKPILALEFSCLKMQVEAPVVISHCTKSPLRYS